MAIPTIAPPGKECGDGGDDIDVGRAGLPECPGVTVALPDAVFGVTVEGGRAV